MRRTPRVVLASLAAMLLLSGCSWMGTSYSILDRDVEASDEMRAVILARDNGIEPSSARFAGENDGVGFWVGRRANGEGVSLLVYPNDQDWVIGCRAGGMKVSGPAGTYGLVVDGAPIPDNGTRLFDNVYVVGR